MSLDMEAALRVFYASAPQTKRKIDTLEISHPAMSKTYVLWREPYVGTVTTETGPRTVQPAPFSVKHAGSEASLDQIYEIQLDTTEIDDDFRREMDRVPLESAERVRCVVREYLSDDLGFVQASGTLQLESASYAVGAATLTAVSPRLNVARTGEVYTPRDVPMLRSFL